MSAVVPITCPDCGAGLGELENLAERSRHNNPLFFYKCSHCGKEFPLCSRHCMQIWKDTLAMERINNEFIQKLVSPSTIGVRI